MKSGFLVFLLLSFSSVRAQISDEVTIRQIFDLSLREGKSYAMLELLCHDIGPRLSGSPGAAAAVEWSRHQMEALGFDSVWLQPVMVPHGCGAIMSTIIVGLGASSSDSENPVNSHWLE